MTPQTLQNDLEKMVCDARDIVLLVVGQSSCLSNRDHPYIPVYI